MDRTQPATRSAQPEPGYQPPRIEVWLGGEALEREIRYAGEGSGNQT